MSGNTIEEQLHGGVEVLHDDTETLIDMPWCTCGTCKARRDNAKRQLGPVDNPTILPAVDTPTIIKVGKRSIYLNPWQSINVFGTFGGFCVLADDENNIVPMNEFGFTNPGHLVEGRQYYLHNASKHQLHSYFELEIM